MKLGMILGVALLVCNTAFAQSDLVGKYSGTYSAQGSGNRPKINVHTIVLEIKEADSGNLKGNIKDLQRRACANDTGDAEGTYQDNSIKITETAGAARLPDCGVVQFEGIADGNKLIGKTRQAGVSYDITLTRSK